MEHKISLAIISIVFFFVCSCSNDPIEIIGEQTVDVSVNLNNFFSSYNFNDTKHNIKLGDEYRVFHSEYGKYIQVRVLFYSKETGNLADSVLVYSENTNTQKASVSLPAGEYYAISTLAFANAESNESARWSILGKEKLSTAKMELKNRWSQWALLSVDTKSLIVGESGTSLTLTPEPVGTICYCYFQNFQYADEQSFGSVADNGIRSLSVYSQRVANAYYLDPNASDRLEYYSASGRDSWYYLSDNMEPQDFDKDWIYFKTNLYDYFYILAPEFNLCFGCTMKGQNGFNAFGEQDCTIEYGKTYLAYWDYFQLGNPYFGIADNNHWNTYSSGSAKAPSTRIWPVEK